MSENKIQVFLSRPNPFTQHQSFFIKEFTKLLKQSGFECVTLQAAEYSPYEVVTSLREMIQRIKCLVKHLLMKELGKRMQK